jgi:hypothetical protein
MAYYWLPQKWRSSFEGQLPSEARQFIDAGEWANKYPLKFLQRMYSNGPSKSQPTRFSARIKAGQLKGDPVRRSQRAARIGRSSTKREAPPQPKSAPKRKKARNSENMSHKVTRIVGRGTYHGKFLKPTRKVKKTYYPCQCKDERSVGSVAATGTSYLIHGSHPTKYVARMMGMAMIHKYFAQNGHQIRNWTTVAGVQTGLGAANTINLTVVMVLQRRDDAASDPQYQAILTIAGTPSYLELADSLANGLINQCNNVSEDMFVKELQWRSDGTGSSGTNMASKIWDATEVSITIYGKSLVNIQNRTAAGDVGDTTLTTSIYANPLHGKHYTIKGFGTHVRDGATTTTGKNTVMTPNSLSGVFAIASNSTTVDSQAQDALKQPPLGNYFYNCTKTQYIRLEPGAIKQSVCSATVTKTLNQWLRVLFPQFSNSTDISNLRDHSRTPIGMSRLIALEKVADMGGGNTIDVAGERDAVYMSKLFFRKRRYTPATNSPLS